MCSVILHGDVALGPKNNTTTYIGYVQRCLIQDDIHKTTYSGGVAPALSQQPEVARPNPNPHGFCSSSWALAPHICTVQTSSLQLRVRCGEEGGCLASLHLLIELLHSWHVHTQGIALCSSAWFALLACLLALW
jgi:hypothetical protein